MKLLKASILILLISFTACKKPAESEPDPASALPKVSTGAVSFVTDTGATGDGNVVSEGPSAVIEVGLCWGETPEPTLTYCYFSKASRGGTGSFQQSMFGLKSNSSYYVRAYATNYSGTAYGEPVAFTTRALWVQNILSIPKFNFITLSDEDLFAGSENGLYYSYNKGVSWFLQDTGIKGLGVNCVGFRGNNIFAGTTGGMYLSVDGGRNWLKSGSGLPTGTITSIASREYTLITAISGSVYVSYDGGSGWSKENTGLETVSAKKVLATANYMYATTNNGLYISAYDMISWVKVNGGLPAGPVDDILQTDSLLITIANGALYMCNNWGSGWKSPGPGSGLGTNLSSVAAKGPSMICGGLNAVYFSRDFGKSWLQYSKGLPPGVNDNLVIFGNEVFVRSGQKIFSQPF